MILNQLHTTDGKSVHIRTEGGTIARVQPAAFTNNEPRLYFDGALVLPGLINSHDHLEFNLYPQLGDRTYENYTQWGPYIHEKHQAEIAHIQSIPNYLRVQWGAYKNLLAGVTTVVNHGEPLVAGNLPIYVHQEVHNLHSPGFEKNWRLRLNNPLKKKLPMVIHAGEGVDKAAYREISRLIGWNLLKRKMIAVHGVAMTPLQASRFKALVWCPQSNYFLLNKTAEINTLKTAVPILFGTDSTLTSHWDIWEHIDLARITGYLSDKELFDSLSKTPASVWGLNKGVVEAGRDADLIVLKKDKNAKGLNAALAGSPEKILLVMQGGEIRLIDADLTSQLNESFKAKDYSLIKIGNSFKYVQGRLDELIAAIKTHLPGVELPVEIAEGIPIVT